MDAFWVNITVDITDSIMMLLVGKIWGGRLNVVLVKADTTTGDEDGK